MERDLENKVALVTGGGRGIGRAISVALARRGAHVAIAYLRKGQAAEDTCRLIEDEGGTAVAIKTHVGDEQQLAALFDRIAAEYERLDVFVSNAATGVIRPLVEADVRAWEWTMSSNARALFLGALHARPLMEPGSNIIALTSFGSTRVLPGYGVVGVSKAAIEALIRYLGVELAKDGIRANAVSPGVVDTAALNAFPMAEAMKEGQRRAPIGRLVTPEEVAHAVDFLTTDKAGMITGHTLVIDGGASLLLLADEPPDPVI